MSLYYPGQKIIVLKSEDFTLNDGDLKIGIKEKVLTFVLFLDASTLSHKMFPIWDKLSTSIAGAKFATCDMLNESDVAITFSSVAADRNSKYMKLAMQIPPFILNYRNGEPKKKYLGVMSEYDIRNWCLNEISGSSYKIDDNLKTDDDQELPTRVV